MQSDGQSSPSIASRRPPVRDASRPSHLIRGLRSPTSSPVFRIDPTETTDLERTGSIDPGKLASTTSFLEHAGTVGVVPDTVVSDAVVSVTVESDAVVSVKVESDAVESDAVVSATVVSDTVVCVTVVSATVAYLNDISQ